MLSKFLGGHTSLAIHVPQGSQLVLAKLLILALAKLPLYGIFLPQHTRVGDRNPLRLDHGYRIAFNKGSLLELFHSSSAPFAQASGA